MVLRVQRYLNKYRRWMLVTVFVSLFLVPWIHLYQTYKAANVYDNLDLSEKVLYNSVNYGVRFINLLRRPFTESAIDLDGFKGSTWSGKLFGYSMSDPLAVLSQSAASQKVYWPFALTALIPFLMTLLLGRFFCGWICPATLLYELNDNVASWLSKQGITVTHRKWDRRIKYGVLLIGVFLTASYGMVVFSVIYPPLLVAREVNNAIAFGSFSAGMSFLLLTLLFDMFVVRRGFCRTLCPGGALYALIGKFRLLRIQREVASCNDCAKCNSVCQFGLDPMRDDIGLECNNCSACIEACPKDSLLFTFAFNDIAYQGPGHQGRTAKSNSEKSVIFIPDPTVVN